MFPVHPCRLFVQICSCAFWAMLGMLKPCQQQWFNESEGTVFIWSGPISETEVILSCPPLFLVFPPCCSRSWAAKHIPGSLFILPPPPFLFYCEINSPVQDRRHFSFFSAPQLVGRSWQKTWISDYCEWHWKNSRGKEEARGSSVPSTVARLSDSGVEPAMIALRRKPSLLATPRVLKTN
jgi:hypothetical protein